MPGRNLSHREKRLLQLWHTNAQSQIRPSLKTIEISGGTGLRGIDGLIVNFRYPITAICGNNGTGKSTILALSSLAHHSPAGWFVHLGNTEPRRSGSDRTYYTFSHFFLHGQGETPADGVSITWRYIDKGIEKHVTFKKTGGHWGRYDKRLEREVNYLPIGRVLPAHEMTGVRSTFHNPASTISSDPLNTQYLGYLSYIMGKQYDNAEMQNSSRYNFQCCTSTVPYTAFNMGGGESCMIVLLHLLQKLPDGGLLVVEEIDAGLHPQAQIRLAEILVEICLNKKIQVVCSTHSQEFLDALPRQARLVIKRSGDGHEILEEVSTRLAMYEMTGVFHPEIIIYCEDVVAATMIEESLPHDLRIRVAIQIIGSNINIAHQGVSHIRSGFKIIPLCIFDGDCEEKDIKEWIIAERGARNDIQPHYLLLPGDNLAPEKWAIKQISLPAYKARFAEQIQATEEQAQQHIEALDILTDHHDIPYVLHQRTGCEIEDCIRRIMSSFAPIHPQLNSLRGKVTQLLD